MDWQKKIDKLIVRGARITEKGRLDFPSRLPICPDPHCSAVCIYRKLWVYLERNERLFEEGNLAIGPCSYPVELKDLNFPILYSKLEIIQRVITWRKFYLLYLDFMKKVFWRNYSI